MEKKEDKQGANIDLLYDATGRKWANLPSRAPRASANEKGNGNQTRMYIDNR
jgi:hypothetical protein